MERSGRGVRPRLKPCRATASHRDCAELDTPVNTSKRLPSGGNPRGLLHTRLALVSGCTTRGLPGKPSASPLLQANRPSSDHETFRLYHILFENGGGGDLRFSCSAQAGMFAVPKVCV